MIRKLCQNLGIPAEILIGEPQPLRKVASVMAHTKGNSEGGCGGKRDHSGLLVNVIEPDPDLQAFLVTDEASPSGRLLTFTSSCSSPS